MKRTEQWPLFLVLALAVTPLLLSQAQKTPTPVELKARPISTETGEMGYVLTQWWKAGTAAGNVGDFYDNRDRGHSDLNISLFPQLQRIVYSPEEITARLEYARPGVVRPGVVFGNSSTAYTPVNGGSNPFMSYVSPAGIDFLQGQYAGNNVYIYPEHNDHDPGHNGYDGGFGDVYPTNTPYLIISQGSSGSDAPFMHAVALTLAAFRPEVKEKLRDTGNLMPTLQMILRWTSKALKGPKEYLSGKAHPTVFEGNNVDVMAMLRLAHSITLDTLPPRVEIKVLKEDTELNGVDFFEPGMNERLADTNSVVARVWRGKEGTRRMRVSAAASRDLNGRPLTYQWILLRGDPSRVKIEPNEKGTEAEITVDYHARMPIRDGSPLESNRVDIGVFVNNGTWFSAPAFITFYSLDSEARAYDSQGRILEIGYGMTDTRLVVKDWAAFFNFLHEETPRRKLLSLDVRDAAILEVVAREYSRRAPERAEAQKSLNELGVELKADDPKLVQTRKALEKIEQELKTLVDQPFRGAGRSALEIVDRSFSRLRDGGFDSLPSQLPKTVQAERQRLIDLGIAVDVAGTLKKTLLRDTGPTSYEKAQLDRYNGFIAAEGIFPDFMQMVVRTNTVDPRLATPRNWRDVYQYDGKGSLVGWTRYNGSAVSHFNRDGLMILKTDALGRCAEAQAVRYQVTGNASGSGAPPPPELQMVPTGGIVTCASQSK